MRLKTEFELKEEAARQEKIKAEAAHQQAEAQRRLAQVKEAELKNTQEKQLTQLRADRNKLIREQIELKQKDPNSKQHYYYAQEISTLTNSIIQLDQRLHGKPDFFETLGKVITGNP
ncbi:MAG: hypothetical protein WA432_04015 [Candidatus Babeliaceae bacterium]